MSLLDLRNDDLEVIACLTHELHTSWRLRGENQRSALRKHGSFLACSSKDRKD